MNPNNNTQYTSLPYRLGVGIMLVNKDNLIFVAKRIDTTAEAWQMPQGGIDEGENPKAAALRELKEETGISNAEIIAESKDWHCYNLPPDLVLKIWGGKYCGQKQKWYVIKFLGAESEINLDGPHPEFLAYQWVPIDQLPMLAVGFKRALYEALVKEFKPLLN